MRIDNHMAGYRPPPPKSKDKGVTRPELNSTGFDFALYRGSSLPEDDSSKEDSFPRGSAQQKVHKRNKLEKAVYVLTNHHSH